MILKVEDALKSLSRIDPVPKVGILGLIPRCLQRNIRNIFHLNTSPACGEAVYLSKFTNFEKRQTMPFEWDENKNKSNIDKHGIDFNDAKLIFNNPIIVKEDKKNEYGEKRWIAIGLLVDFVVVVVYTMRTKIVRIISIRLANKKEKEKYDENFK